MAHILSKSKYIRGLQCERAMWLDVYRPGLARYSREQMRRFDAGREFERAVKSTFPNGVDVSAVLGRKVDEYPAYTARLLDNRDAETVFEAGFQHDGVLVLADVVCLRDDGAVDVYEIKSGSVLSTTYRHDAALQFYVVSHCREVHSFSLIHAADETSAMGGGFVTVDLTADLAAETDAVSSNIGQMKTILSQAEPDTPTGSHCIAPYACPYQHYCQLGVRQLSLF